MVREVVGQPVPAGIPCSFEASRVDASPARKPHRFYDPAKRISDVVLAILLLLLTWPLVAVACVAIVMTSRQAPLLLQKRVGRLGREFTMFKLRTMDCEEPPPAFLLAKLASDRRVTAVGRLLRRTSIDELPQLVNVVAGQMTLIGPRPALPSEVAGSREPWRLTLSVRPGLTGLWQVSGRSALPPNRRMTLDRFYVVKRSLGFDMQILAKTVVAVVSMRGAW